MQRIVYPTCRLVAATTMIKQGGVVLATIASENVWWVRRLVPWLPLKPRKGARPIHEDTS